MLCCMRDVCDAQGSVLLATYQQCKAWCDGADDGQEGQVEALQPPEDGKK